ncbi:MAG: hypothetical protein JZU49_03885 [Sulfuricurvum sp.]|nr:hypothetical protein [Sulfuricurvum sp.]
MSYIIKFLWFVSTVIIFNGCSTLNDVFIGTSIPITKEKSVSPGSTSIKSIALPSQKARCYTLPKSYDTAYSYRTNVPFSISKSLPKNLDALRTNSPDAFIDEAVDIINNNAKNDFERVKMAHDIIALTVRYDAASFWAGIIPDQDYRNVLKTRLAVCEGYANTFNKFCDKLNIPCEIVSGFGRGVGTSPLIQDTPDDSNHAWNIVTIYGENYLIDVTWDSGYMDGKVSKQAYTTNWLFIKPDHFIYTHYPEMANQQLLSDPISATQFIDLPYLEPNVFDIAKDFSICLNRINQVENSFSLSYTLLLDDHHLTYTLHDIKTGNEVQNRTLTQANGSIETVHFSIPSEGQYIVNLFSLKNGSHQGKGCGEFIIQAKSASSVQYPTFYQSSGKNIVVINPIEMPLKKGNTYTFQISAKNKNNAAIIYGKTFIQLEKINDNVFELVFKIPNNINELIIGIADSKFGQYESIAKYVIN